MQKLALEGFETLPIPVQSYVQTGVLRIAYMNERSKLVQSAQTVAMRDKKAAGKIGKTLGDNLKALRETGEPVVHGQELITLYANQKALRETVKDKENKAGCGPKQRSEYTDAIAILQGEEIDLLTIMVGHRIEPRQIDAVQLSKVVKYRATKRKEKADAKQPKPL